MGQNNVLSKTSVQGRLWWPWLLVQVLILCLFVSCAGTRRPLDSLDQATLGSAVESITQGSVEIKGIVDLKPQEWTTLTAGAFDNGSMSAGILERSLMNYGTDVVGLVWESSRASGNFLYLVRFLETYSWTRAESAFFLGDRVSVETMELVDGQLAITLLYAGIDEQGNQEPLCCPGQRKTMIFEQRGTGLALVSEIKLSPPHISQLFTSAWVLAQAKGPDFSYANQGIEKSPSTEEPSFTLIFNEEGGIGGRALCNRWFSTLDMENTLGDGFKVLDLGSTKMFCNGDPESMNEERWFTLLQTVGTWRLDVGRLILTWSDQGGIPWELEFVPLIWTEPVL